MCSGALTTPPLISAVCVCVCLSLYLLHIEYQDINSTSKVETFLRILAGPHNLENVFVKTWLRFELALVMVLVGMVKVRVRST